MFSLLTAIMISTIIAVWLWIYTSERHLRIDSIRNQIELVNSRIINAYENDYDAAHFLQFVGHYYKTHPLFEHIRITLLLNDQAIESLGEPITVSQLPAMIETHREPYEIEIGDNISDFLAISQVSTSADGQLIVATILPFRRQVLSQRFNNGIYSALIVLAILLTIGAYITSRRLGRNIKTLQTFAQRAGSDPGFNLQGDFANDELGDISRQIVKIAQDRNAMLIRSEHEHKIAIDALQEKNRIKYQLANDLNHELKTPVAVIKGYVDTIVQHPEMDDKSRFHFLAKISEHTDRLSNIIRAQGYLNSLEDGSLTLQPETTKICEIINQVAADLNTAGLLKNIKFICKVPDDCLVLANQRVLNAVIANLIKNAAIHSQGSECVLELENSDEDFHFFRFFDDGIGVPNDRVSHLFERFYRVDVSRSRQRGGSGLGLSIVKAGVEASRGKITVNNRADHSGLEFHFSIPKIPN